MANIHERLMVTVNTSLSGECVMLISRKNPDGKYVVCNDIHGEDAVNLYEEIMGIGE